MITAFNTYSETRLYFPCPNCGKNAELGLLAFISAINRHKEIWCIHCQADFYIELNCLTRAAEHRNEAEGEQTCPSCSGVGHYLVGLFHETCTECEGTGHV